MHRTIIITGVTSGFGLATARVFAKEGWNIIGTGRRKERLDALAQELGDVFLPLELDSRNRERTATLLGNLPSPWHEPDVLLNNAGLALGLAPAQAASLEDWEVMVDTNIKGVLYATKTVLPGMVARNCGHIVNVGSITGHYPYAGANVYAGTKAFVTQFSQNLRADLLGTAIRVTCIEPGLAESEFSQVRFKGDKAGAKNVYAGTDPLVPEDIAETIRWVVSQPPHVNINRMEIMPVCQAPAAPAVYRKK
jgi:NADP-dependent 3-hydroxy acid dehydrogenase YdfG